MVTIEQITRGDIAEVAADEADSGRRGGRGTGKLEPDQASSAPHVRDDSGPAVLQAAQFMQQPQSHSLRAVADIFVINYFERANRDRRREVIVAKGRAIMDPEIGLVALGIYEEGGDLCQPAAQALAEQIVVRVEADSR